MNEFNFDNLYQGNHIRTFSGIYINVFDPTPDMISIEDIAHSLSHQCRFAGHLPFFYSVAQHSFYCSELVPPEDALQALMHDASEAYLMDIPKPIKNRLPDYQKIEDELMKVIAKKFNFPYPLTKKVKLADEIMLEKEWDQLMLGNNFLEIECWDSNKAKIKFIEKFNILV